MRRRARAVPPFQSTAPATAVAQCCADRPHGREAAFPRRIARLRLGRVAVSTHSMAAARGSVSQRNSISTGYTPPRIRIPAHPPNGVYGEKSVRWKHRILRALRRANTVKPRFRWHSARSESAMPAAGGRVAPIGVGWADAQAVAVPPLCTAWSSLCGVREDHLSAWRCLAARGPGFAPIRVARTCPQARHWGTLTRNPTIPHAGGTGSATP